MRELVDSSKQVSDRAVRAYQRAQVTRERRELERESDAEVREIVRAWVSGELIAAERRES